MKAKLIFILVCLFFNMVASFAQTNVSGIISANTTWSPNNNPYIVTGYTIVGQGVTLTIQPGVIVKFDYGFYLYLDGTLDAQGTINDSIFFISNNVAPGNASWAGIKFRPNGNAHIMRYCHISNAQNGITIDNFSSSIVNTFTISNSLIENNQAGLYSYFDRGGLLENNVIRYNLIGISSYSTINFDIIGNTISNNNEGIGDDTWGIFTSNGKINNNIISHNAKYGVYWHSGSNSTFCEFTGNTIDGNSTGLYLLAYPVNITKPFQNNLIVNNVVCGIYLLAASNATITNNEITGNLVGILNHQTTSAQNLTINQNCIYQNGINFKNNNTRDVNLTNNWWGSSDSTVISSTIYDFYDDFAYGIVLYTPYISNSLPFCNYNANQINNQTHHASSIELVPNPLFESAILKFENPNNEKHVLIIRDMQGKIVRTLTENSIDKIIINRDALSSGMYLYELKTDYESKGNGKFVIQ